MNLKDLIKAIPEDLHNCLIEIDVPSVRAGDEGYYPLIQVELDQIEGKPTRILLIPDCFQ